MTDIFSKGSKEGADLFVIVVDGVDDVLLAILDDPPDCAANHVTCRDWGDDQSLTLALQAQRLVVLKLKRGSTQLKQSIQEGSDVESEPAPWHFFAGVGKKPGSGSVYDIILTGGGYLN